MIHRSTRTLAGPLMFAMTLVLGHVVSGMTVFEDDFEKFALDDIWQAHAAGLPDVSLQVISSDDSSVLEMRSSGQADELRGIEWAVPRSVQNLIDLTVDARVRPINAGVEGTISAAELAVIGDTGEFVRAFVSNNAGPEPETTNDWANHYEDSLGHSASSGPWPHCGAPACDAIRNLVLTFTLTGTTLQVFDDDEETIIDDQGTRLKPTYEVTNPDFTIAHLGASMTLALRQQTVAGGDDAIGYFDSVVVTTTGLSEVVGDYNGNNVLDVVDLDLLSAEVRSLNNTPVFDLNMDFLVDSRDRDVWVIELKKTWYGDANLDGLFNTTDLVSVFQRGEYEDSVALNSTWAEGDWDGDGDFGSGDFVVAFQGGGYEKGPRQTALVPEPCFWPLWLLSGVLLWKRHIPRGRDGCDHVETQRSHGPLVRSK